MGLVGSWFTWGMHGVGAALVVCGLSGCGGDPEPAPAQESPPTQPTEPAPASAPRARDVVVTGKARFPEAVMELRPGDLVEVSLAKGGRARGRVEALKPEQLALASEGTSVITRLTPPEVSHVRLVHRPPPLDFLDGSEQPRSPRESWSPRFAGRMALEGVPEDHWRERFADNIPLVVSTAATLSTWNPTGRMGDRVLLSPAGDFPLAPNDQLKLVACQPASERKGNVGGADLGTAQVWLHRRGRDVTRLVTTVGLPVEVVEAEGLARLLERDPGTFLAQHPGTPPEVLLISRSPSKELTRWQERLEALPDRAGMRRLRAQRPSEVASAEAQVRRVYAQLGAEAAAELGRPLTILLVRPIVQERRLALGAWSRELGLE